MRPILCGSSEDQVHCKDGKNHVNPHWFALVGWPALAVHPLASWKAQGDKAFFFSSWTFLNHDRGTCIKWKPMLWGDSKSMLHFLTLNNVLLIWTFPLFLHVSSVVFAPCQGNAPQGVIASPASACFGLNQTPMPSHGGAGLMQSLTVLPGFGYNQPYAYPAMLLPLHYG